MEVASYLHFRVAARADLFHDFKAVTLEQWLESFGWWRWWWWWGVCVLVAWLWSDLSCCQRSFGGKFKADFEYDKNNMKLAVDNVGTLVTCSCWHRSCCWTLNLENVLPKKKELTGTGNLSECQIEMLQRRFVLCEQLNEKKKSCLRCSIYIILIVFSVDVDDDTWLLRDQNHSMQTLKW